MFFNCNLQILVVDQNKLGNESWNKIKMSENKDC